MSSPKPNAGLETNEIMSASRHRDDPGKSQALFAETARAENVSEFHGRHMLVNRLERTLVDLRYLAADVDALEAQADAELEKTRSLASHSIHAACTAVQMSLAVLQPPDDNERPLRRPPASAFHRS